MTPPEITFSATELSELRQQAEIRQALRRVEWGAPVDLVRVTHLLHGGLSGALVVQLELVHGAHRVTRVAKLDSCAELRREWSAYQELIDPFANSLCAPITASTPDVTAKATADSFGGLAVIVYDHVAQQDGDPAADLRTLEELVRAALHGPDEAVNRALRVITTLFAGMSHVLYNRHEVVSTAVSLRPRNLELGPNLSLRVEAIDRACARESLIADDEVLQRTLCGHADDLQVGDIITLVGLRHRLTGEDSVLVGDAITVRLDQPAPAGEDPIAVSGTVVDCRGAAHRARLADALDSRLFGDPFAALPGILLDPIAGRVRSVVHGDLNPRNVLVLAERPHVIDYAHTAEGRPQHEDFCWLEIGLSRDVFAVLGRDKLVDVQRILALASHALDWGVAPNLVADRCSAMLDDQSRIAFRILWAVRQQAARHYPAEAGEPWPQAYLRHLVLAAHRTLKWRAELQTPSKLSATAATAGVATEWLAEPNPFQRWQTPVVASVLRSSTQLFPVASDDAVTCCAQLVAVAEADNLVDVDTAVAEYRTSLVRARCSAGARRGILNLGADRPHHVGFAAVIEALAARDLVAIVGGPGVGMTTLARELTLHLSTAVLQGTLPCRMPVLVSGTAPALDIVPQVAGMAAVTDQALALGALHLIIDDFDEDNGPARITELRNAYPHLAITVCRRANGADLPGFSLVRLREMTIAETRSFMHKRLVAHDISTAELDHFVASLVDDPTWQRAGLHRPRLLAALAEHIAGGADLDDLPPPHEINCPPLLPSDTARRYCERLATRLVSEGLSKTEFDSVPEVLLRQRVLTTQDGLVGFRELIHRDYFAAVGLVPDFVRAAERLVQPNWHEAAAILVTLPQLPEEHVRRLISEVEERDVMLAARLMREARRDPNDFVLARHRELLDPDAGPATWQMATAALCELGGSHAAKTLHDVVVAPASASDAGRAAFAGLARLRRRSRSLSARHAVTRLLANAIHSVLTSSGSETLITYALDVLTEVPLPGIDLVVSPYLDAAHPWPVVTRAATALRTCGAALPQHLLASYHSACRRRLAAIEAELPNSTSVPAARAMQREREDLVRELAMAEGIDFVVERRFDFGLSELTRPMLDALGPGSRPARADLLTLVSTSDPTAANLAGHFLLNENSPGIDDFLLNVDPAAPPHRLLIAAAAVRRPDQIPTADRLARALLPAVDRHRLPALAALLCVILSVDRLSGVRLAWTVARDLADRSLPERHRWPYNLALARCRGGTELAQLLSQDGDDPALAVEALASFDFHRWAAVGPACSFPRQAKQRLLGLRASPVVDLTQWIRAAAAARLVEALPDVLALVPTLPNYSVSHGGTQRPVLDDALAITGYLARCAHQDRVFPHEVDAAHQLLDQPWPRAERGRLVGLAYLGDWQPIAAALLVDEQLAPVVRNLLEHWYPGPCTPPHAPTPAAWFTSCAEDPTLPNKRRWLLRELAALATTARTGQCRPQRLDLQFAQSTFPSPANRNRRP